MACVFLSYDHDDKACAKKLAAAVERAGHSILWDRDIKGGAQFNREIELALQRADAIIVLWSRRSVESSWVRDEAAVGRDSARLVPVVIEDVQPPLGFRQFQTIDLGRWKPSRASHEFEELLAAISALTPLHARPPISGPEPVKTPLARRPLLAIAGMILLIAGAAIALWIRSSADQSMRIAVVAADKSPRSIQLARDLFAKLGSFQAVRSDSLNLTEGSSKNARLILEIGATGADRDGANLFLLASRDRSLLWSRDFSTPVQKSMLGSQLALSAGRAVDCALDAFAPDVRLDQQTIKLYLNGCASFDEDADADPRPLIPLFREIVQRAPQLSTAWAKLVMLEADSLVYDDGAVYEARKTALRRDLAKARELDPTMSEASIAETSLLPDSAYEEIMQLIDQAKLRSPQNPGVLLRRADFLQYVGRMSEAIQEADQATKLDPLSPTARAIYIKMLSYAGQKTAAERELKAADELWPGTDVLADARSRFDLRYGNPDQSLQKALSTGQPEEVITYLAARADPTPGKIDRAIASSARLDSSSTSYVAWVGQLLAEFGRNDELYRLMMTWPHPDESGVISNMMFRPAFRGFRHDVRFMQVAKRMGLLDYWQKSGSWPDFCFDPDLPYDCREQGRKLLAKK